MANTFDEQAKERFRRSLAFMQKAHALLQDDLVYRSALADAVSAIKNMLQGYLLLRVSTMPASAVTQRWQEVAVTNRMPDLIQACIEAGLSLHGLERDIKRLNNERNYRTHDDPQRLVNPDQAAEAYELALTVQKRIKAAVQGKTGAEAVGASSEPVRSGNSGRLAPVRAAMSGTLSTLRAAAASRPAAATAHAGASLPAPVHEPAAQQPAAAKADVGTASTAASAARAEGGEAKSAGVDSGKMRPSASEPDVHGALPERAADGGDADERDDEEPVAPDETYISLPVVTSRRRRRGAAVLVRGLVAAALLIVGVVAGAGLMIPVARGQAPSWLGFASRLVATPTPAATATPTAMPTTSPTGLYVLGSLMVTVHDCTAGAMTLQVENGDTAPITFAIGDTDSIAVTFTETTTRGGPQPGLVETVAPMARALIAVQGAVVGQHVVIVSKAGALEIPVPAC